MQENTQEKTPAIDVRNPMRAVTRFASGGRRYPTMAFAVAILALTALSTHGTLDGFARERLNETTVESSVMYVVAMGIDLAISMVPGEGLNPLNDVIGQFRQVMTWSIGSLLLQVVVLAFVSSTTFKWIFAMIATVTLTTLIFVWLRRSADASNIDPLSRFCRAAARIFILATVVRFIVPVFVLVSYLAGQALLQPEIDSGKAELSAITEDTSGDGQQILDQIEIEETDIAGPEWPEFAGRGRDRREHF